VIIDFPKTAREAANASINTLIKMEESKFLEFKTSMINGGEGKPNSVMQNETTETLAGFLNSDGGTLVIGYNDDNDIIMGIEQDFKKLGKRNNVDGWQLQFNNIFKEHIGLGYSEYLAPIEFDIIDGKTLAKISVSRSSDPVFWEPDNNTEAFPVRFNNSTRKLGVKDVSEYIDRHFTKSDVPILSENEKDENEKDWRDDPPTKAQLNYLQSLGHNGETPKTKGEASDLITKMQNEKD
jgi:predicted HTH transcriptional regulator